MLQSADAGLAAALPENAGAVAAFVAAAVAGPFAKPQRHAEAVKAACHVVEACSSQTAGGAAEVLGTAGLARVQAAVQLALPGATGAPKLEAQLTRLQGFLGQQPSSAKHKQGGSPRAAHKAAVGGKPGKQQQKQAQQQAQGSPQKRKTASEQPAKRQGKKQAL